MKFDPDKHHRRSIRLRGYDYSKSGAYFITICVKNRECILSEINKNVGAGLAPALRLNSVGKPIYVNRLTGIGGIVEKNWNEISDHYPHVRVDDYVIMPNHLHGVVVIESYTQSMFFERAGASPAPTLGQIIGMFKSKCAIDYLKYIESNNLNIVGNLWQRNYYERIIRDENDLKRIREYIRNNPSSWDEDEENQANKCFKNIRKKSPPKIHIKIDLKPLAIAFCR